MSDVYMKSLELHRLHRGKLETVSKVPAATREDLALAYSPGVAEPCREIAKNPAAAYDYTMKSNTVAVISDGSAVLGLGDIGALASLPVMEGKCVLFREFAGLNAVPIVVDTRDTEECIRVVKSIAGAYWGINLEDIAAPRCFEIEERLKSELDIPVMHDDQHGTAIVTLAWLINALRVTGKTKEALRVVVNGLGAGGTAIINLLLDFGVRDIVACDSRGIVGNHRTDLNAYKQKIAEKTNPRDLFWDLAAAVEGADVFIGVSVAGVLWAEHVQTMAPDPIIFALANPEPEIRPEDAHAAGARIVATGRSDYPNQVNNALAFPGIFLGALEARVRDITDAMKLAAAHAIASLVEVPDTEHIIPDLFDPRASRVVAEAVRR